MGRGERNYSTSAKGALGTVGLLVSVGGVAGVYQTIGLYNEGYQWITTQDHNDAHHGRELDRLRTIVEKQQARFTQWDEDEAAAEAEELGAKQAVWKLCDSGDLPPRGDVCKAAGYRLDRARVVVSITPPVEAAAIRAAHELRTHTEEHPE